jgi:hypothetical protein
MTFSQYRFSLLLSVLFVAPVSAQTPTLEEMFPERAIIMEIGTRIVEQNQQVVWNSENSRVTIPGRPVGIKLVGDNIVVAVQFTPYIRPRGNNFLVAQGQVWINDPHKGMSYYTSMQTIPMEFDELVYFFPLGPSDSEDEAQIEIQLMLRPYTPDNSQVRRENPKIGRAHV